jgi:hypothetical protein
MNPLSAEELDDIKSFLESAEQLKGERARFEFVGGDKVNDGKAPHYILAFCKEDYAQYINVGYVLEKTDLYLQSKGFGSVWLGMAQPEGKENKEDYCIMLAFGKTEQPLRNGAEDFNRLSVEEMSNEDNDIARAARLAPSAVNSQPWKLKFESGKITVEYQGRGLMKGILRKKMNKVDVGIITRHIELALLNEGKTISDIFIQGDGKSFAVEIFYA